jgi:hypothetical protein
MFLYGGLFLSVGWGVQNLAVSYFKANYQTFKNVLQKELSHLTFAMLSTTPES